MVIPGIYDIQKDLSTTATIASWITSAFLNVGVAVSPLFGKLGDIYGKKRIFLTVLLFYIAGVGLAGFASNIYMFIASRAVQGIGFAIVPLGLAIITDVFPRERVATAQGIISGTFAIGAAADLIIGAYIVQDLSWQWAFHTALHSKPNTVIHSLGSTQGRTRPKKQGRYRRLKHANVWHSSHTALLN